MLFSIITPSHNIKYIEELYETILEQTYTNWEWIIYLNGGSASTKKFSAELLADERVKIHRDKSGNKNVGYLKNRAFNLGIGDVLVEVDHDDLLTANCLEKLKEAFESDPEVGFAYSEDATLHMTEVFQPFNPAFGWTYKHFNYKGRELIAMDAFKPDSGSMAFIWYMPDHVRAWRRTTYIEVGGHDENLGVLDDQDLIVRTYLKSKFYFIPEVLYIYRIFGGNTWLQRNQDIQTGTVEMFHKYGYQIAERDADLRGLLKVDIGGGIDGRAGYMKIDQEGGDINCDLNDGIPLPDNSVGVINASHVLEHLKDPLKSMREIHRVLVDGGWAFIDVPSTDGRGAFQDPTHISYWNQNSFLYYTEKNQARFIRNNTIRFQTYRMETTFYNDWWKQNNIPCVVAWLRAIKSSEKRPHLINI